MVHQRSGDSNRQDWITQKAIEVHRNNKLQLKGRRSDEKLVKRNVVWPGSVLYCFRFHLVPVAEYYESVVPANFLYNKSS